MAACIARNDCGGSVVVHLTDVLWNENEDVECEEDEDIDCEMKAVTLIGKGR
jgi:hypothetical protein